MAAENLEAKLVEGKYLMYKDKPLVREGNTICYGDKAEKCILAMTINMKDTKQDTIMTNGVSIIS